MPDEVKTDITVSQVDQIGEIFSDFAPVSKETPKEVQKEEPKETPKEEPKETPKETPKEEPKEEPKPDEKDTAIGKLMEQVAALTTKITELSAPKKEEPKKEEPKKEEAFAMGFFKDKAEYEAAFEKPEVMSEVMSRVRASAVQDVLKALPQVINNTVKAQIEVQTRTAKFYTDNEDLTVGLDPKQTEDRRKFIGYVANDISGKNPDWTLDKLFTELPKEVRMRLGMKAEAKKEEKKGPAQPGSKKGGRVPDEKKPELSPLQQEIADLM